MRILIYLTTGGSYRARESPEKRERGVAENHRTGTRSRGQLGRPMALNPEPHPRDVPTVHKPARLSAFEVNLVFVQYSSRGKMEVWFYYSSSILIVSV